MKRRALLQLNPISLGLGLSMLCSSQAWAVQMDAMHFGTDIKITAQSEEDRDLGTRGGGDANGIALDLRPWLRAQRGDWSAFAMGQAVVASDIIQTDTLESSADQPESAQTDGRTRKKNYLALREFWVDYAGLTDYPGEHLRLGRQRLHNDDGQWRDSNIEALNWSFDTTLLQASLGAAQRFSEYRSDLDELAPEDEDRLHLYGDIAAQWQPGHWLGFRAHHSRDDGALADPNQPIDALDKRANGNLTWLGLHAHSDAYNFRNQQRLNYWASLTSLTGERNSLNNSLNNSLDDSVAGAQNSTNLNAWATDLGLRLRLDPNWQIGAAYARGSGGGDADGSGNDNYRQTGLHSNRSTFTGTRSSVQRFGEAFRGELSNLQAATLFGSWQLADDYDASLVYHHFWRVDAHQQIGRSGINARFDDPFADLSPAPQVALVDGEKALGQELDLVVTKYFKQGLLPAAMSEAIDEPAALVRLRGGVFKPGDAYGSDTDSLMHRAFIDVIWKF